jgi:hypothetical protein
MNSREGIVVKVTEQFIVVIHPEDGTFANIPRPKNQVPHIGEKFTYQLKSLSLSSKSKWMKWASAVCLIILSLFVWSLFQVKDASAAAYVVAIDINPSLEVYIDSQLQVVKIVAMNRDGANVSSGLDFANKNLFQMINSIIDRCVEQHYLKPDQKGIITTTIIPLTPDNKLDQTAVSTAFNNALSENHIEAQVQISVDEKNTLDKAHQLQLSVNKYKLYEQLQQNGQNDDDPTTPLDSDTIDSETSDESIIIDNKDVEEQKEQEHPQVPIEKEADDSGTEVSNDVDNSVKVDKEKDHNIPIDQETGTEPSQDNIEQVPNSEMPNSEVPKSEDVKQDIVDTGGASQEPVVQEIIEQPIDPTLDNEPTGE